MSYIFALAFRVGVAAGLRALTPPAVVAWAAHLGWLNLNNSPLAFMGSTITVIIFSLLAVFELIGDVRPRTPKRTAPMPLLARILMGGLCGACICAADGYSMKHSGNATRSGRAEHRRFHAKNFRVAAARSFAAGLALPCSARRVAVQPDCNRNLPPFSVRCRAQ